MNDVLKFDGERFTPESVREIWYEHMHRYAFAMQWVSGLDVLDAACGEGYGSSMLSRHARTVKGVDVSAEAVAHANRRYASENLGFSEADCAELPFTDDQFDCVVSFETIEHLERQEEMLAEFSRVLKPSGFLLISSPDKAIYSDQQGFDNPHHVRELYRDEFQALLDRHFPVTRMLGQKLLFHSAIWPLSESSGGHSDPDLYLQTQCAEDLEHVHHPIQSAMYLIAVCAQSEASLPATDNTVWMFDDQDESVYQHYQDEIRKHIRAGTLLAERDQEIRRLEKELKRASAERQPGFLERIGLVKRR